MLTPGQSRQNVLARCLGWLGGHELIILVLLFAAAAGAWGFAALASEVMEGETGAFDRAILLAMRHPGDLSPIGPPAFQEAVRDVSALGSAALLGLITLFATGFLALDGKRHMAYFTAGSVVGGLLVSVLLKGILSAPGPRSCRMWRMPQTPVSPADIP